VVVVQDLDDPPAHGAMWGEVQSSIYKALGCAGTVTDGCVRDLKEVREMGFHFFARGPGVLVNAGTGSIAYARAPDGEIHRAGGYGWQLGDEGGGYWLGRRALELAARAQDGRGEGSTLLARLLAALGLQQFDDLVRWTATATPAQVAALAPHVLNAAREGEVVAQRAVGDAARELGELVVMLSRHFPDTDPIPVAITGGLLLPQSPLTAALREQLAAGFKRARLLPERIDAALGALKLAAELV